MRNRTRAERKRDRLPGIGFIVILCGCALADSLMAAYPLPVATAVLASMVLVGGYLILRACA